jgi:hypothetical protein
MCGRFVSKFFSHGEKVHQETVSPRPLVPSLRVPVPVPGPLLSFLYDQPCNKTAGGELDHAAYKPDKGH